MLPFCDNMTFFERWINVIVNVYDWGVRKFQFLPTEEEYARKYFAHLAPLPSIDDLHRNVSIVLVNNHLALSPPRPSMPSNYSHFNSIDKKLLIYHFKFSIPLQRCYKYWRCSYKTSQTVATRYSKFH